MPLKIYNLNAYKKLTKASKFSFLMTLLNFLKHFPKKQQNHCSKLEKLRGCYKKQFLNKHQIHLTFKQDSTILENY